MTTEYRTFSSGGFYRTTYVAYMLIALCFCLSVHPSCSLSVTRVDQLKMIEVRIMKFSPYSSPIPAYTAVFCDVTNYPLDRLAIPKIGMIYHAAIMRDKNIGNILYAHRYR